MGVSSQSHSGTSQRRFAKTRTSPFLFSAFSIDVRERSERQLRSCWKVCHHNTACLCFVGMKEQLSSIRLCTSAGRRVPIVSNSTSPLGLARGAGGGRARQHPALLRIRSAHDGQSGRHPTGNSSHVHSGGLTTPPAGIFKP